jgi:hypothetical protein
MFYRLKRSVAGLVAIAAAVPLVSGCPHDPVHPACKVEPYEVTVPHQAQPSATPLMLLSSARLDAVGDAFVLLGTDGDNVRWARLSTTGMVVGDEQSIAVPAHALGPWFAVAGTDAAGDHLVIGFVPPQGSPATSDLNLMTFSVGIDNTGPTLPISSGPIGSPSQITMSSQVTMMSGRGGMNAGIAWAGTGHTTISARIVRGDGVPIVSDLNLGSVDLVGCMRFSPGRGDLTLGYVDRSGTPPGAIFVGTELDASGKAGTPFKLNIGEESPGCVELVPTISGYGVAWHSEGIGTYFSPFNPASAQLPSFEVLSDVEVREAPALGGLGWLGTHYAVLFVHEGNSAEVWPIDAMGRSQGALPPFPSAAGHLGQVSAQPVGSALYATYADYASREPGDESAGERLLVKVSCP